MEPFVFNLAIERGTGTHFNLHITQKDDQLHWQASAYRIPIFPEFHILHRNPKHGRLWRSRDCHRWIPSLFHSRGYAHPILNKSHMKVTIQCKFNCEVFSWKKVKMEKRDQEKWRRRRLRVRKKKLTRTTSLNCFYECNVVFIRRCKMILN